MLNSLHTKGIEEDTPQDALPREEPVGERLCLCPFGIPLLSHRSEMAGRVRPLKRQ